VSALSRKEAPAAAPVGRMQASQRERQPGQDARTESERGDSASRSDAVVLHSEIPTAEPRPLVLAPRGRVVRALVSFQTNSGEGLIEVSALLQVARSSQAVAAQAAIWKLPASGMVVSLGRPSRGAGG